MRVSFVLPDLRLSGGMLIVIGFANGLAARGHAVTLVAPRRQFDQTVRRIDDRVRLAWTRAATRPGAGRSLANALVALDLALAIPPSDVILATYTPTLPSSVLARAFGRGTLYWLYADYPEMFLRRPVERWIGRTFPLFCRGILTNSVPSVGQLPRSVRARASVVGLGLPDWDTLGPPPDDRPRSTSALYVGDGRPRKGLADFLAAAAIARRAVPDLHLYLATKDDLAIDSPVPFTRVVRPTRAALADLYRRCGVFVSTSWVESLGLPPLEAMACGAPVVLAEQRGDGEYAADLVNCLVVPSRCPERAADAMVRVLTDPGLARRLGEAGRRTAERYRWEPALDRLERAIGACDDPATYR